MNFSHDKELNSEAIPLKHRPPKHIFSTEID